MQPQPKIALVQDAVPFIGGAERVLQAVWEIFPQAPLYTLVYRPEVFANSIFSRQAVHNSWLNRLPGAKKNYRYYLPLMPLAVKSLDLSAFDIILSFSYAIAHGVRVRPGQLHLSYIYTPLRYAWLAADRYLAVGGYRSGLKGWLFQRLMTYLRCWSRRAAAHVDHFMAVSTCVQSRVWRAYHRQADVVYPPVDLDRFYAADRRAPYYLTVSRLAPHKQVGVVAEAFSKLGLPLVVIGDGPQYSQLAQLAGPTVQLLGWQPDEVVATLLSRARAFVHAGEEDFGIALVEAQAAGCPVIAYEQGGAQEIIQEGKTGFLFKEQSTDSLADAIEAFERSNLSFPAESLRANADRFNKARFKANFLATVERAWQAHITPATQTSLALIPQQAPD
jgi:glycosyltransferase involved in cell wall biosynthesis